MFLSIYFERKFLENHVSEVCFIFMICLLAVSLFCAHACSGFNGMLTKFVDSTVGKTNEVKAIYYFSLADFENAEKYAKQCIKTSSDSSKCTELLQSIYDYQKHEKTAAQIIAHLQTSHIHFSSNIYLQHLDEILLKNEALNQIEICQAIAKKYTSPISPLSIKTNILYAKYQ